jgi:hypothetical protein
MGSRKSQEEIEVQGMTVLCVTCLSVTMLYPILTRHASPLVLLHLLGLLLAERHTGHHVLLDGLPGLKPLALLHRGQAGGAQKEAEVRPRSPAIHKTTTTAGGSHTHCPIKAKIQTALGPSCSQCRNVLPMLKRAPYALTCH